MKKDSKNILTNNIKKMRDHTSDIAEGVVGTISCVMLSLPMYHEEIEFYLKVCSGLLSILAGAFTIVAMYNKIQKYKNNGNNNI